MTNSAIATRIAYGPELVAFGTPALVGAGRNVRRVSTTLSPTKGQFDSQEALAEMQVADMRHGVRGVAGRVEGELSLQNWDDWIEAVMRGTWTAGVSASEVQLTNAATIAASSRVDFGGGDPVALGFRVGDVIRFTNMSNALNNGRNYRIVSFGGVTNRQVTVSPAPPDQAADTAFTVAVVGRKVLNGTVQRSFTIEQIFDDRDISERFTGCRLGSMQVSVPPTGIATVAFDVQGRDFLILDGAQSPHFTTIAAAPLSGVLTGLDGGLRVAGQDAGLVTAIEMNINLNLSSQPVLGTPLVPNIFYGRTVVTGSVSTFLADRVMLDAFTNETEVDLVVVLPAAGAEPRDFISLNMQRVKLGSPTKTIAAEGGVIVQFPYQALLRAAGAGFDGTTLTIQRSNA